MVGDFLRFTLAYHFTHWRLLVYRVLLQKFAVTDNQARHVADVWIPVNPVLTEPEIAFCQPLEQ